MKINPHIFTQILNNNSTHGNFIPFCSASLLLISSSLPSWQIEHDGQQHQYKQSLTHDPSILNLYLSSPLNMIPQRIEQHMNMMHGTQHPSFFSLLTFCPQAIGAQHQASKQPATSSMQLKSPALNGPNSHVYPPFCCPPMTTTYGAPVIICG